MKFSNGLVVNNLLRLITVIAIGLCSACGGGGGGSDTSQGASPSESSSDANVHPIAVNGGAIGIPNLAFTTVTVCEPGSTRCVSVNNVIVDTGSSGLRLVAAAAASLSLPAQLAANSNPLFACIEFADSSFGWGAVRRADVKLGSNTASSIPIQIIGDAAANSRPAGCGTSDSDDDLSTVANMGGNGIIGVGHRAQDCGTTCVTSAPANGYYFSCNGSSCAPSTAAIDAQIKNPIAFFPTDNNGVIIDLPAVSSAGATSVTGSMIFGIGTRSNNALGNGVTVYTTNDGYLTTRYNSVDYDSSFIDSGSNGLFFPDSIANCPNFSWFYCPPSTLQRSARIIGENNNFANISFSVANAATLNGNFYAFNNLAGYYASGFNWGLPFFFGRKVFTGFEIDTQEPYVAF